MKTDEYLSEDQIEALQAACKINNELHDKFGWNNPFLPRITVSICSYLFSIELTMEGVTLEIYSSEHDSRLYYKKSDKYETFYSYIKRAFREYKEGINNIKL